MKKITVIQAHEHLNTKSIMNKTIMNILQFELPSIQWRHLDSLYPDYRIDISHEQNILVESDIIIMQFPIYWYYVPAIMKSYIDQVWAFGFAFGPNGDKLKGKKLYLIATTGGPEISYRPDGKPENYSKKYLKDYLFGLENAAHYMSMEYKGLISVHCVGSGPEFQEKNKKVAIEAAHKLIDLLKNNGTAEVVIS